MRWCFYTALIAVSLLAVLPWQQLPISTGWDKSNHLLAFFVLLALLDQAYPQLSFNQRKLLPLLAYGVLIECVQAILPSRFFSLLDIVADSIGLGLYWLLRDYLLRATTFLVTKITNKTKL